MLVMPLICFAQLTEHGVHSICLTLLTQPSIPAGYANFNPSEPIIARSITEITCSLLSQTVWLPVLSINLRLHLLQSNKKLSYLLRKRVYNIGLLYGANGISIWNSLGIDHECDSTAVPSVESVQNDKFETCKTSQAFDSFWPTFNTLVLGEPLDSGPRNLVSRN